MIKLDELMSSKKETALLGDASETRTNNNENQRNAAIYTVQRDPRTARQGALLTALSTSSPNNYRGLGDTSSSTVTSTTPKPPAPAKTNPATKHTQHSQKNIPTARRYTIQNRYYTLSISSTSAPTRCTRKLTT